MVDVTALQQTDSTQAATVKGPNQTLGQDQFLTLLIAQLKHQDPLNPADNAQFIAQLAQFSQLEQTKQMSSALNQFVSQQTVAQSSSLVGLVGRTVMASVGQETPGLVVTPQTGQVIAVTFADGTPKLVLNNGAAVTASQILEVR